MLEKTLPLILLLFQSVCEAARILALLPMPMRSHWIVMEPMLQELAARGHQLTVFSPFPQKTPLANYTDVDLSSILPPLTSQFSVEMIKERLPNPWASTYFFYDVHEMSCKKVLHLPQFQNILKSKNEYDLVITEVFGTDCYAYFAYKLNLPFISFTTSVMMPWAAERLGLPDNPSYIPNYLTNLSPHMTLWERTYNTLVLTYAKFMHQWIYSRWTQQLVEENFGESLPPLHEVVYKTSLLFVNSYHSLSQSRPFPPNVIEVGGIHIRNKQPLPQDLQQVLNNAEHGVILMSFGSLLRAATFPKSIILMFLNVFSRLPQTVIFKYEESLPEVPPNVIVRKWLPQRDIIEHEKVILFIAHGGLSSTIEAVHFGKPMVGIPFFADQRVNIKSIVTKRAGVQMDLDNVSEQKIESSIKEIIDNPMYRENMKRLSMQFRDRPLTPLQSAVYWTEYVIRHQGAPHLRPASVGMPLYQYLLLDVLVLLLSVLAVVIVCLVLIVKKLFSSTKVKPSLEKKKPKKE